MKNVGALIISLDFELVWGVFDKIELHQKVNYFENTKKVIPEILQMFERYDISCTWAVVGMLFNENWEEWKANYPSILPTYDNPNLSAYNFGERFCNKKKFENLFFASEIINLINETKGQEIATHSYSHYYCLEPGQTLQSFEADLLMAKTMASKWKIDLKSLVFPRNQFNTDYLKVCENLKLINIRSNPPEWYWQNTHKENIIKKIMRTGDAYVGTMNKSYKRDCTSKNSKLILQKASRFFRPHSDNKFLNDLKVKRIKAELTYAAKNSEIYHLWWHPHNFGTNPKKNLEDLDSILHHFKTCQDKYDMKSLNMNGFGKF